MTFQYPLPREYLTSKFSTSVRMLISNKNKLMKYNFDELIDRRNTGAAKLTLKNVRDQ